MKVRKDAWDLCWASDAPHTLAIMEKTKMVVLDKFVPQDPIVSSGYLASFSALEVRFKTSKIACTRKHRRGGETLEKAGISIFKFFLSYLAIYFVKRRTRLTLPFLLAFLY
jgi:hypothetical protein